MILIDDDVTHIVCYGQKPFIQHNNVNCLVRVMSYLPSQILFLMISCNSNIISISQFSYNASYILSFCPHIIKQRKSKSFKESFQLNFISLFTNHNRKKKSLYSPNGIKISLLCHCFTSLNPNDPGDKVICPFSFLIGIYAFYIHIHIPKRKCLRICWNFMDRI